MDWQNVIALLIVAVAVVYLGRLGWLIVARKKSGGCGSCGSCASGAQQSAEGKPLVTLEIGAPRKRDG